MKSWMFLQPFLYGGMLMRGIVINNEVQVQPLWRLFVDGLQKLKKLLMPMARLALCNDMTLGNVQSREERCGPMPLVVVSLPGRNPGPQRQQRLSAVQSLDLTLLVDREDECVLRRTQVEPDYVLKLLEEIGVLSLKVSTRCGFS